MWASLLPLRWKQQIHPNTGTYLLSVTSHQTVIFIVLICYCQFQVCQLCHCFGLINYIYILIVICTLATRYTHTVSDLCIYFYRVNIVQAVNGFSTCLLDHIKTYMGLIIKSLDIQDEHEKISNVLVPQRQLYSPHSFSKQLTAIPWQSKALKNPSVNISNKFKHLSGS